ncbi:MAG: DUF4336 domain-containing protein [Cyanobacteria bacterium J06635_15]
MDQVTAHKAGQKSRDFSWPFWPLLPLYPYGQRRTLRREVVKNTLWTFDQIQGIFYVVVPIRMTVVKLESGGLLVYAPVAPTPECIRLVQDLVAQHGDVKYIILPTVTGLEHKVFVGPFARRFPQAEVFVVPNQWSYPVQLPLSWLGFPRGRTHILPADSAEAPFGDEFDYTLLGPIHLGLGPFGEAAFYHRRSGSLLVTDTLVSVPDDPPEVLELDPYPLLFHAKDTAFDQPEDTPPMRRKGWHRIALFAVYFRPSALDVVTLGKTLKHALKAPDHSRQAYFGLYPFAWKAGWETSFQRLHSAGRLWVAPVLQTLILNRAPQATLAWVERVAQWPFERIIPCHLDAPLAADAHGLRQAFAFLGATDTVDAVTPVLPEADFDLLRELEANLTRRGITPPAQTRL